MRYFVACYDFDERRVLYLREWGHRDDAGRDLDQRMAEFGAPHQEAMLYFANSRKDFEKACPLYKGVSDTEGGGARQGGSGAEQPTGDPPAAEGDRAHAPRPSPPSVRRSA